MRRRIISPATFLIGSLALVVASGASILQSAAQTIGSRYTSTAPKDCRVKGAGNGVDDSSITG